MLLCWRILLSRANSEFTLENFCLTISEHWKKNCWYNVCLDETNSRCDISLRSKEEIRVAFCFCNLRFLMARRTWIFPLNVLKRLSEWQCKLCIHFRWRLCLVRLYLKKNYMLILCHKHLPSRFVANCPKFLQLHHKITGLTRFVKQILLFVEFTDIRIGACINHQTQASQCCEVRYPELIY